MSSSPAPVPEGSFVILWAGEDPVLHSALLEQLDSAGIPYADKSLGEDQVAPTADPFPIDWKPRFGFEVAVLSTDLRAGEAILEPLLEREPIDIELPVKETEAAAVAAEAAPGCTEEKPTFQVWSSDEPKLAQFVTNALRENEIPARTEIFDELSAVFIPRSCEGRAREIIREVLEATPPA
jgi:hypothetical protein